MISTLLSSIGFHHLSTPASIRLFDLCLDSRLEFEQVLHDLLGALSPG